MTIKRSSSPTEDLSPQTSKPETPKKKPRMEPAEPSTPKSGSSPKKSKGSKVSTTPGGTSGSAKARYLEMLIEAGLKHINKVEVQNATGFSPDAQRDMMRKDKGSLRRALANFASGL